MHCAGHSPHDHEIHLLILPEKRSFLMSSQPAQPPYSLGAFDQATVPDDFRLSITENNTGSLLAP